ncbi:serine protease, partial [bacterium]
MTSGYVIAVHGRDIARKGMNASQVPTTGASNVTSDITPSVATIARVAVQARGRFRPNEEGGRILTFYSLRRSRVLIGAVRASEGISYAVGGREPSVKGTNLMPIALLAVALLHQRAIPKAQAAPTIKALYERCRPSVVSVEVEEADGESTGTGFFYGDGRTVVTSFHLLLSATRITVRDDRGKTWRPKTVAIDLAGDTAILGLGVETGHVGLKHAPSQEVGVGDEILVIGDPEGLRATLSTGIVSALRTEDGVPLVQITAPISHGSSGGPVLDRKGHVLGVVKAFLREGQNLNLAVSTQVAKWILARRDEVSYQTYLKVIAEVAASRAKDAEGEDAAPAGPLNGTST